MSNSKCPLCESEQISLKLTKPTKEKYWDCHSCGLIFLDQDFHLAPSAEEARYRTHNNDVTDIRYQKFVSPIVDYIANNLPTTSRGLDYGAGPGPVISVLLQEMGYDMTLFDPYFWNDQHALTKSYDFIVCCEVVEHFYSPAKEFQRLKSLLKSNAQLAIMTDLYSDEIDFDSWYYHRDPTHVVFYRSRTFEWIKNHFAFKDSLKAHGRALVLLA